MADSKSEKFKEEFKPVYTEALNQIDKMNKKFNLAVAVMDEIDGKTATMDQAVKDMVRYEMAVRFNIEKHKVIDVLFAGCSPVLDLKRPDGTPAPCPDCSGTGVKTTCRVCNGQGFVGENQQCKACKGNGKLRCGACGGIGRLVDHNLTLFYKQLFVLGDISRALHMMSGGGQPGADPNAELLKQLQPAFKQMYAAGVKGHEAEDALKGMAEGFGMDDNAVQMFIGAYEQYCAEQDAAKKPQVQPPAAPVQAAIDGGQTKTA